MVGIGGAFAANRLIESMLFDTSPVSPGSAGITLGGLLIIAAVATARPAVNAIRTDPVELLRTD